MRLTDEQLKAIYPNSTQANRDKHLPFLNKYFDEYEVSTKDRLSAFLAQIGHESAELRYSEEIASGVAYEGRKDLGNTKAGDGVRFKGRGLIQITGRANYVAISKDLGVDFVSNPKLLQENEYAVLCAFWYWKKRWLNRFATDKEVDFKELTRRINGGYNGYADRVRLWNNAKKVLQ